jgi:hypothetical protein
MFLQLEPIQLEIRKWQLVPVPERSLQIFSTLAPLLFIEKTNFCVETLVLF